MKPPARVQVGASVYVVREPTTMDDVAERENSWAVTNHRTQTILLKPRQAPDVLADSVLHEVLHCCWFHSGNAQQDTDEEERIIRTLSPILLDTMRRNPRLVKFLMGEK